MSNIKQKLEDWYTFNPWAPVVSTAALVLASLLIGAGVTYLSATQEAAAFNRLTTGPKVTTWDAVWLDLRIEASR